MAEKDDYELYKFIFEQEEYLRTIQEANLIKHEQGRNMPTCFKGRVWLKNFYEPEIYKAKVTKYEEARRFLKTCGKTNTPLDRLNIVLMRIQQAENIEFGS
jgi:hypothetical protein